jgi:hypothetical protein
MNTRSRTGSKSYRRFVMFAAVGAAVAAAAFPRSVEAAKSPCMDLTWAQYNDCLVESRWEALKKLCDLEFYVEAYACAREAIAE